MPFGIVAIVYSARVDSEWNAGRYDSAIEAAASAKKWTWVSVGIFVAAALLYVIFLIFVAAFAFFCSLFPPTKIVRFRREYRPFF